MLFFSTINNNTISKLFTANFMSFAPNILYKLINCVILRLR